MAENVRVIVRCRPPNKRETELGCKGIVKIRDCVVNLENPTDANAPSKTFTFDNAYDFASSTEAIYNDICYSLVENVLEGYNGTIFAYGQTGCGKSHTMQGPDSPANVIQSASQRGIILRSFDHIFEAISVATEVQYLVLVSYLEIYNENIRDLLNVGDANYQLKEIPGAGVVVQNLSTHAVQNAKECEELFLQGNRNRAVGATDMNATSSRSHSIFTVSIEQIETQPQNEAPSIKKGKLNLVDLAGSERQAKTGATGMRLKEATKINLSLSALGNVISALVDAKTKHIPYRDSKLTRLLQDSLGGNTKTLMIACISPADNNYDETLSTLRYASRAKNISNKPTINEDPKDTMLREYQEEIVKLRKMLESSSIFEGNLKPQVNDEEHTAWLDAERRKVREEYESETKKLRAEHDAQKREKEELVSDMMQLKMHYENQMKNLQKIESNNNSLDMNLNISPIDGEQLEALNRMEVIKKALIGGERANDTQLKEKRQFRKIAAQRRLSALAQALSRVEHGSDRDLIQEHYTDIQQELRLKTESLKSQRHKVRALEREVSDLQSEFQLDRADYLETIRRLESNLKFHQQLLDLALPILRKDGKYWIPEDIQKNSQWNDDLKMWKLPEDSLNRFRLPPTASASAPATQANMVTTDAENQSQEMQTVSSSDIANNYFRPKRNIEIGQRRSFNNWRELSSRLDFRQPSQSRQILTIDHNPLSNWPRSTTNLHSNTENRVLDSWLLNNSIPINKTWGGLSMQNLRVMSLGDGEARDDSKQSENGTSSVPDQLPQIPRTRTDLFCTRPLILDQQQRRPRQLKALFAAIEPKINAS